MCETWLHPNVLDDMVNLPGFNLYRHDRIGKKGGGVGIFVRSNLSVTRLATSPPAYCSRPEYLIVSVSDGNSAKLLLCVVYRPPKIGFISDLENDLIRFLPSFKNVVIMGDFNSDMCIDSYDSRYLKNLV